jgi:GMP synthase (glutamine-hydrolysing)
VRVLAIVHERSAGGGVFNDAVRLADDELLEWIPAEADPPHRLDFDAVLVFGGAMHAEQEHRHGWLRDEKELLRRLLGAGTPALGVCLGAQLLAEVAGGRVTRMPAAEIGWTEVQLAPAAAEDPLLRAFPQRFSGFQWHSYEVSGVPRSVTLARGTACLQAFRLLSVPWWGIQFHAEATIETIASWIEDHESDPDAVRAEIDWGALLRDTRARIARWSALGQILCDRFLEHARPGPTTLGHSARDDGASAPQTSRQRGPRKATRTGEPA